MQFVASQPKQTHLQEIQQHVLDRDRVLFANFFQFCIHHASHIASASHVVYIQTTTSRSFFFLITPVLVLVVYSVVHFLINSLVVHTSILLKFLKYYSCLL